MSHPLALAYFNTTQNVPPDNVYFGIPLLRNEDLQDPDIRQAFPQTNTTILRNIPTSTDASSSRALRRSGRRTPIFSSAPMLPRV